MMGAGWFMGAGWMTFFWLLLISGGIWAIWGLTRSGKPQAPRSGYPSDMSGSYRAPEPRTPASETPLQTLDRRLASGDLSLEEYTERRALLGGDINS